MNTQNIHMQTNPATRELRKVTLAVAIGLFVITPAFAEEQRNSAQADYVLGELNVLNDAYSRGSLDRDNAYEQARVVVNALADCGSCKKLFVMATKAQIDTNDSDIKNELLRHSIYLATSAQLPSDQAVTNKPQIETRSQLTSPNNIETRWTEREKN